jgi:hypothetical protein
MIIPNQGWQGVTSGGRAFPEGTKILRHSTTTTTDGIALGSETASPVNSKGLLPFHQQDARGAKFLSPH